MIASSPAFRVRAATPHDFARIAELRSMTLTEPITEAMLIEREAAWPSNGLRQRLVACIAELVVAYAHVIHYPGMQSGAFYGSVDVQPDCRGRGIGTRLAEDSERYVQSNGNLVLAAIRDDRPEGRPFLEKRGYVLHQHLVDSVSEIKSQELPPRTEGFQVLTWSEIGDSLENRRRLHELHNESDRDTPGSEIWGSTCYELFEVEMFGSKFDPETLFVAVVEGEWVGMTSIERTKDDTYGTHYTGVMHGYRGRGIGRELKRRAVEYAISQGAKWLRTQNDVRNAAMLAINNRFGFKAELGWLYMKKEF